MRWVDRIAGACLVVSLSLGAIWWLGVWVPQRDAHLFAVHDCFLNAGCQERASDIEAVNVCWSSCDALVRSGH
jgi:hypothetical protein